MSRSTCPIGLSLFIGCLLCGSAQASPPDLLILGLHGEVAGYDTTSGTVHSLTTATLGLTRDHQDIVATKGAFEVDYQTTLTLYVVTDGDGKLATLRPYGPASGYNMMPVCPSGSNYAGYFRGTLFDRRHRTLAALPLFMMNGQPSTGTLPVVADYLNGQLEEADPRDCLFVHDDYSIRPTLPLTESQMISAYPSCSGQILQTNPYDRWQTWGVSRKIWTHRATEEHYTTATASLTTESLHLSPGEVIHGNPWGPITITVGGTSATAYLFVDRPTSTCTFFRHDDFSDPYTFDEAVVMMRCKRGAPPLSPLPTGGYDFYLRQDHVVVHAQVDPEMRVLYADLTRAYFARREGANICTWDTSRSNELYRMSLSPQGCGQLQRLPDLPFPPLLMFRIPWEDLP